MYLQEEFENVCCNIRWLRAHQAFGVSVEQMFKTRLKEDT